MIPRSTNIVVSNQLPPLLRDKLVQASLVEWPALELGESMARRVAVDSAIEWGKATYPSLFKAD